MRLAPADFLHAAPGSGPWQDGQVKRTRCTEEQITAMLRQHGVSEATLHNWKAKYGGLDVSKAKRLRPLEAETPR